MPAAPGPPWSPSSSGVTVSVRLTPKGGRDAIDGIDVLADGRAVLKARVAAPPSEGAANEALCRLIAKAVGIAPRDVALVAGGVGRIKRLAISGDPATLIASLEKIAVKR